MKTPTILTLVVIFFVCATAVPIADQGKVIVESTTAVSKQEKIPAGKPFLVTLVQFVMSNSCFIVTDATLPYVEENVTNELRVKIGDWCLRLSQFIISDILK